MIFDVLESMVSLLEVGLNVLVSLGTAHMVDWTGLVDVMVARWLGMIGYI